MPIWSHSQVSVVYLNSQPLHIPTAYPLLSAASCDAGGLAVDYWLLSDVPSGQGNVQQNQFSYPTHVTVNPFYPQNILIANQQIIQQSPPPSMGFSQPQQHQQQYQLPPLTQIQQQQQQQPQQQTQPPSAIQQRHVSIAPIPPQRPPPLSPGSESASLSQAQPQTASRVSIMSLLRPAQNAGEMPSNPPSSAPSATASAPVSRGHHQVELQPRKPPGPPVQFEFYGQVSTPDIRSQQPKVLERELATPEQMFEHFQNKLKATIDIDYLNFLPGNNIKLLDNEFKLLTTTNGIYAEPKIVENLKTNLLKLDPKLVDKLSKRSKTMKLQDEEFTALKERQIAKLRDVQAKKDQVLKETNSMDFPSLKLARIAQEEERAKQAAEAAKRNAEALAKQSETLNENGSNNKNHSKSNHGKKGSPSNSTTNGNNSFVDIAPKNGKGGKKKKKKAPLVEIIHFPDVELTNTGRPKRKRKARVLHEITEEDIRMSEETDITAPPSHLDTPDTDSKSTNDKASATPPPKKKKKGGKGHSKKSGSATPDAGESTSASSSVEPSTKGSAGPGKGKGKKKKQTDEAGEETHEKLPKISLSLKPRITDKEQKALDKQYDNTYVSIWKDLARKDGPKAYRLFQQSSQAKQINLRKTAMLAARESKRWQAKTNKSQKDLVTKARRSMREMLNFWKKNEREERNLRQKAEQEAIQKAKKEEEAREAKRQARKLNFLINQTELYSHFIGKKIKTSELEGDMGDKNLAANAASNQAKYDHVDVDMNNANSDFKSLDFDQDDEVLQKTAAANAQSALMDAQQKAKEFNSGVKVIDEDGEMNFQNPSSIGDMNISQPKLLNCTLKEYQLKGLNWLANLYEQGINGILADEMGLGKTVQSISVLAYLAETHNIWGPFLVVTPASTLHNWHQEIQKFVPDLHVLPYWGNSKDRKTMRKTWDRKSIVYNKNHEFHVVVTSYQLAVADAQYFQKMKWQYMILDEAQAIKSSQSARWKSLLSFSCRNRLLLTGTPIQNSMQELWALLHFIMPSLFDSHDEFSEWFSKDIESHAHSNTQLNEQQLRRLHAILKPFMLRRIKKNVQSELGDKIEIDVYCDLTNRQKQLYRMLRSQINIMDLIDNNKKIGNDDESSGDSLMNVVMQFRKVCNHPDLFERADTQSPFAFTTFAETSSFLREANDNFDSWL
ncbi:unnamed protein product [Ambrosiozyma monospora]|uniref:Chromatin-remodeling ATPase INO80 n=1 Tax=Ambrosiozyma monospora TaxID=43982 RepID=A0A9W7DD70_AMBMO|nr:unnamed protein product [Ambrosiozyma monospora]